MKHLIKNIVNTRHYTRTINLKKGTPQSTYTAFCNKAEKDGCFVTCGNTDEMWIIVSFEDEMSFKAWIVSLAVSSS